MYLHETFQIVVEALARFSSVAAEQAAIERSKEASWGRGLSSSFLGIWARHARLDPRDEAAEAARRAATTVKSCVRAAAAPWAERRGMSRKWTHSHIVWIKKLVPMRFFWLKRCYHHWYFGLQVNNYEIVVNFFHISHNLTWCSAIVHKSTRI